MLKTFNQLQSNISPSPFPPFTQEDEQRIAIIFEPYLHYFSREDMKPYAILPNGKIVLYTNQYGVRFPNTEEISLSYQEFLSYTNDINFLTNTNLNLFAPNGRGSSGTDGRSIDIFTFFTENAKLISNTYDMARSTQVYSNESWQASIISLEAWLSTGTAINTAFWGRLGGSCTYTFDIQEDFSWLKIPLGLSEWDSKTKKYSITFPEYVKRLAYLYRLYLGKDTPEAVYFGMYNAMVGALYFTDHEVHFDKPYPISFIPEERYAFEEDYFIENPASFFQACFF